MLYWTAQEREVSSKGCPPRKFTPRGRGASCQVERERVIDASHTLSAKVGTLWQEISAGIDRERPPCQAPGLVSPAGAGLTLTPHGGSGSLSIRKAEYFRGRWSTAFMLVMNDISMALQSNCFHPSPLLFQPALLCFFHLHDQIICFAFCQT